MDRELATFEKLTELHEKIKSHPYRLHNAYFYLKSYQDLLYQISSCFYWQVRDTEYKKAGDMTHDFNGAIGNLGRKDEGYIYLDDCVLHVEQCLGVIHHFLDTKTVPFYVTYYSGYNNLEGLPRHLKVEYLGNGKWEYVLTREQIEKALESIRNHYPSFPPTKWNEIGIYSKEQYDYLMERLEALNGKIQSTNH